MDTTIAEANLLLSGYGALAEFERSLIRQRLNAGLAEVAKRGRRGGRPPAAPLDEDPGPL